ncbi:hypothetical protein L0657_10350 [Dyadobacter sp. CY345]|uniref:hypothetical protein n=1 Tax=Dyadobacter sp. CY345 TaxID=2909335 RepID=UPI001F381FEA|nr:hypothetical protein [Dyadobacter sp. CY345]MCF2444357.1 hypothetical protein [Dyadobacter sp. CY345]
MQKKITTNFTIILLAYIFIPLLSKAQSSLLTSCEPAKDYSVIKKGDTKCITGNTTITYLTLEGGTLIIDGNARINNLAIDGGKIVISKSSSALLPPMTMNDVTLSNGGAITYMGNVNMSSGNNYVINENTESRMDWGSSELNMAGGNSTFTNNGTASIGTLRIEGRGAKVILGNNSLTNVTNLISTNDNKVTVPQGTAKLGQAGYAQLSKSLTLSSNLTICPGPAAEIRPLSNSVGGYGKAIVMEKGCSFFPLSIK